MPHHVPANDSRGAWHCSAPIDHMQGDALAWNSTARSAFDEQRISSELVRRTHRATMALFVVRVARPTVRSLRRIWRIAYFDVTAIVTVLLAVFESVCGDVNAMLAVFRICCAVLGAVTVSESVEDCPFWLMRSGI